MCSVFMLHPVPSYCRWNDAFQKEVLNSRLSTTQILTQAISKAQQPPQAWVLVTGVGMLTSQMFQYCSEARKCPLRGNWFFFSAPPTPYSSAVEYRGVLGHSGFAWLLDAFPQKGRPEKSVYVGGGGQCPAKFHLCQVPSFSQHNFVGIEFQVLLFSSEKQVIATHCTSATIVSDPCFII